MVARSACPGRFTRLTAAGSIPSAASCTKWSPTTKGRAGRTGRASTAPPSLGPRSRARRAAPGGARPRRAAPAGSPGPQPLHLHPGLEPNRGELHQVEPNREGRRRQDRQGLNRSTLARTSIPTAASCTRWSPTTKSRAGRIGRASTARVGNWRGPGSGLLHQAADARTLADGGHGRADRVPWEVHPADGAGSIPTAASCTKWRPTTKGSAGRVGRPQPLHLHPGIEPNRGELHPVEPDHEGQGRQDRQGLNRSGREPAPGLAPARWLAPPSRPRLTPNHCRWWPRSRRPRALGGSPD